MRSGNGLLKGLVFVMMTGLFSGAAAEDKFDNIKRDLSDAKMIQLMISQEVKSRVFDEIDSSRGDIAIAGDGRYAARVGDEIYLFDGKCIWEVSESNRQATKQCLKEGEAFDNRLFFVKDFDAYFSTEVIKPGKEYRLLRKKTADSGLPDTIGVRLNNSGTQLAHLEFKDLNGDLNRVEILSQRVSDSADDRIFMLSLPDSIQVITLP